MARIIIAQQLSGKGRHSLVNVVYLVHVHDIVHNIMLIKLVHELHVRQIACIYTCIYLIVFSSCLCVTD